MVKVGIDIVLISEFLQRFSDTQSLSRAFLPGELEVRNASEHLAGVFAAKEAFFKALGQKADWLTVWVEHEASGKPVLKSTILQQDQHAEMSISYTHDLAVAVVIIDQG